MTIFERYKGQIILQNFGKQSQELLSQAKVLIIGAGGIGCAVIPYLVAAGVGSLAIIDDDIVELSNLHRQILYKEQDIGSYKVDIIKSFVQKLNSNCVIEVFSERLTQSNIERLANNYDLIIDGSDNFTTRFIVNEYVVIHKKTLVSAAVKGYEAMLMSFDHHNYKHMPCYNCYHPKSEASILAEKACYQQGILGSTCALVGSLVVSEVVKLITMIKKDHEADNQENLIGKLLYYRGLTNEQRIINIVKDPECKVCVCN